MRFRSVAVVAVSVALAASAAPAATAGRRALGSSIEVSDVVPGEVVVRFRRSATAAERRAALASVGGSVTGAIPSVRARRVALAPGLDVPAALGTLAASDAIARVEPNHQGTIANALLPNDPCVIGCFAGSRQWNVGAVNAPLGWGASVGTFYDAATKKTLSPIRVAVLDTRIDPGHPDWGNYSPVPLDRPHDARDGGQLDMVNARDVITEPARWAGSALYHGTFVAGILGASANNSSFIAGLGYHAQVVPVTVVDGNGAVNAFELAQGIDHAREVGARVINMSLVMNADSFVVQDAISLAHRSGSVLVAAAGNNGSQVAVYPAAYPEVIAVAATDEADRRAGCSNHGTHISVAAPGQGILSLHPSTAQKMWVAPCGTSTAAPHVASLAALLLTQDPSRTPLQVRSIIEASADDDRWYAGYDQFFGWGRVNFERALRFGQGPRVDSVVSSTPPAVGGTSVVAATAVAPAGRTIAGAELFLDDPTSTPYAMSAVDGTFDSAVEPVRLSLPVPTSVSTGVHRIFVRARDGSATGAAAVGVLIVDRGRPTVNSMSTSIGIGGYQPVRVQFVPTDDYAQTIQYKVSFTRFPLGGEVFATPWTAAEPGKTVIAEWMPELLEAGQYTVTVTVKDEAGNTGSATGNATVL